MLKPELLTSTTTYCECQLRESFNSNISYLTKHFVLISKRDILQAQVHRKACRKVKGLLMGLSQFLRPASPLKGMKTVFYFMLKVIFVSEAVAQRCSVKTVFLEISQNSHESTCARVSFLNKAVTPACSFIKKEALAQLFCCKFVRNF